MTAEEGGGRGWQMIWILCEREKLVFWVFPETANNIFMTGFQNKSQRDPSLPVQCSGLLISGDINHLTRLKRNTKNKSWTSVQVNLSHPISQKQELMTGLRVVLELQVKTRWHICYKLAQRGSASCFGRGKHFRFPLSASLEEFKSNNPDFFSKVLMGNRWPHLAALLLTFCFYSLIFFLSSSALVIFQFSHQSCTMVFLEKW